MVIFSVLLTHLFSRFWIFVSFLLQIQEKKLLSPKSLPMCNVMTQAKCSNTNCYIIKSLDQNSLKQWNKETNCVFGIPLKKCNVANNGVLSLLHHCLSAYEITRSNKNNRRKQF